MDSLQNSKPEIEARRVFALGGIKAITVHKAGRDLGPSAVNGPSGSGARCMHEYIIQHRLYYMDTSISGQRLLDHEYVALL